MPSDLQWQLDPALLGPLLALLVAYTLAIGPLRKRIAPGEGFPGGQALRFYLGLLLLYLVEGSPLHDLAERYLFSAHMTQHLLVSYLVAPILLWGTPDWLLRQLLVRSPLRPLASLLGRPLVAFAGFNLFLTLWHIPAIYDGALQNNALHHGEHLLFLFVSLMFWWPLMSPLPELPRAPHLIRLVYLFTTPIAQLPLFGAVTFAQGPLYATYAAAPRLLGLSAQADQALGGVVMKVTSLFVFGIPFIVIFLRWYASETRRREPRPADA